MQASLSNPDFHPSQFQDVNINARDNIKGDRTLLSVREERGKSLVTDDLNRLESPGSFKMTVDDKTISGSNTKHMFKNLYGETPLTFLFFSSDNVSNIQKLIRFVVFKETGQKIDDQSQTDLLIIMRSIFLEYHRHPLLIDETMKEAQKRELLKQYTLEVSRLNELVINETVPRIISNLEQYVHYLYDCSSQPVPMEKPKSDSVSGTRTLRSTTQILLGGSL